MAAFLYIIWPLKIKPDFCRIKCPMLTKTQVIILRTVRYGDNSIILKTFSRGSGVLSFIASLSRKSHAGLKNSLLQPLNQIEAVYYTKAKGDLKRLKEARMAYNYQAIPFEAEKTCVGIFMAEVLQHLLQEEEPHPELFDYLQNGLRLLDASEKSIANFHLAFIMQISAMLGFAPERPSAEKRAHFFDLMEGNYVDYELPHRHFIQGPLVEKWRNLQAATLENCHEIKLKADERYHLLEALLDYCRLHITDFGELKSLPVLRQVLH